MANLQILNSISDEILIKLDVQHHVIMIHIKLKDIHPHIFLLNFKFLTKKLYLRHINDLTMFCVHVKYFYLPNL